VVVEGQSGSRSGGLSKEEFSTLLCWWRVGCGLPDKLHGRGECEWRRTMGRSGYCFALELRRLLKVLDMRLVFEALVTRVILERNGPVI